MCDKCKNQLKLISFKWNDDKILYKYKCKECNEIVILDHENNEEELKNIIDIGSVYNKYNL